MREQVIEAGLRDVARDMFRAETDHTAAGACVLVGWDHPVGHITVALDRVRHVDDGWKTELIRNLGERVAKIVGDDQVRLKRLEMRPDVVLQLAKAAEQRLLARELDAKPQISEHEWVPLIEVDNLCTKR